MKLAQILLCVAVLCLVGCKAPGTDARPFDGLNGRVQFDDAAVGIVVSAQQSGLPVQKEAAALYTAEIFVLGVVIPLDRAACIKAAALVLEPGAVTLQQLDTSIAQLRTDVNKLHLAGVADAVAGVSAAKAAATAKPTK